MTTIVCETASLADALRRAGRVAPKRGTALVQSGGFVFDVGSKKVLLRATDTNTFFSHFLYPESIEGDQCQWRVSSALAQRLITSLPAGSGQHVTLRSVGGVLEVSQGSTRATLPLMDAASYPQWLPAQPPENSHVINGFGSILDQVAWAAQRGETEATSAVLVTEGEVVAATGSGIALAPHGGIEVLGEPALVSLASVSPVLAHMPDVAVWLDDNSMYLSPNEFIQVKCRIWGERFPAYKNATSREFEHSIRIPSEETRAIVTRLRAVVEGDKLSAHVWLTISAGQIEFFGSDDAGIASVTETLKLPEGEGTHAPTSLRLRADVLSDALNKSPGSTLVISYDTMELAPALRVDGEGGYSCWVPLIRKA